MTLRQIIESHYDDQVKALAGLTDKALKGVVFYVTEVLKFKDYRLEIHYPPKETQIIIHILLKNGSELFCKHKKPKELDELAVFLGIPNYKIKLAEKTET